MKFEKLFIFEMANNHMGDIEHGKQIIDEMKNACQGFPFNFAIKFQYRYLDTFIHPDYSGRDDIKYVKRFSETRISEQDFITLKEYARTSGFLTVCTPFDEMSVKMVEKHCYDYIKVASCSFTDWPLLEEIAKTDLPIIISSAGASFEEMDQVVAFLKNRNKEFCLMHCVGAYPTKKSGLQLNQIDVLKKRYSDVNIGFSTHEEPDNMDSVKMAVAKGADVFERHVGVATEQYALNVYSSSPGKVKKWLESASDAYEMAGEYDKRHEISEKEINDLRGLKRGVFAKRKILKGEHVNLENVFLAIPNIEGQIIANDLSKYTEFVADADIDINAPIMDTDVTVKNLREKILLITKKLREILLEARVALPSEVTIEISHHFGVDQFERHGAVILNCINREYCKKLLVLFPGQSHPFHKHIKKEETFQVLYGEMNVMLEEESRVLKQGELLTVPRGVFHSFSSETGCVFEEISTTSYPEDSFYKDSDSFCKERKTHMVFRSDWLLNGVE